jgi:predicted GNAT family acetyltransferase
VTGSNPVVADAPERSRYEATIDGRVAGFLEYRRREGRILLVHTEVDAAFEGRGVGGALARHALDAARREAVRVRVACPFVTTWLRRHPEYAVDVEPTEPDAGG